MGRGTTGALGDRAEQLAHEFLLDQGLRPVARNFRSRGGEIDLIMLDRDQLCFIEVKYRHSRAFGGAAYSIPAAKQHKISQAALSYISRYRKFQQLAYRFDALLIQNLAGQQPRIEWIPNAFDTAAY